MKLRNAPSIYYIYSEDEISLDVQFDTENDTVVVRGGRNGFACLADVFSSFCLIEQETGHYSCLNTTPESYVLMIQLQEKE